MSLVQLRLNGLAALQQRLKQARDELIDDLTDILKKLGEEAVTHAKLHKGYKDRTANLKNSISYALYFDGEPIVRSIGTHGDKCPNELKAQTDAEIKSGFEAYEAEHVQPKGFTIIVVAGMSYAQHVEHKGYNVLYLTRDFLQNELKQIVLETIEDLKTRDV